MLSQIFTVTLNTESDYCSSTARLTCYPPPPPKNLSWLNHLLRLSVVNCVFIKGYFPLLVILESISHKGRQFDYGIVRL